MILTFAEQLKPRPALLKRFHQGFPALKTVTTQRIARVQVNHVMTEDQSDQMYALLLKSPRGSIVRSPSHDQITVFELAFRPAVLDPEHSAIEKILKTSDFYDLVDTVKLSTLYRFEGLNKEKADSLVRQYLFNDLLHVMIPEDYEPESLTTQAKAEPLQIIEGFRDLSMRELMLLSEKRSLYMEEAFLRETQRKFRDDLRRDPTDAELEYLAQRTSDHCFHTTWKSLGLFKTLKEKVDKILPKRKDIVSVFVDNSGVMASADQASGMTYMIKGETHNAPTAIAPVGGVETMHGGCLRDIMGTGQGGYPTMATQVFIIGTQNKDEISETYEVDQFLDPLVILRGMIQGVQNYGNPMGVPNFCGRVIRHPQFFGKPMALGICLGTGENRYSSIGTPKPGDIALLIGNPTGRDGIHGATMSSAANEEKMIKKEGASVQIGDPYTERLLMEATPALRPLIRAYGDLGAGGIASCFGEMAECVGIEIDLEHIPTKYDGLSPWEKLESESQERMGIAVSPENLDKVKSVLKLNEIPYHVLGTFTGDRRFVVKHGAETIVDLDYEWLESFPVPERHIDQFITHSEEVHLSSIDRLQTMSLKDAILKILSNPDLADQSMFFRRWDNTIQGKSLRESCAPFTNMPYDQGITIPDPDTGITQVLSFTVNPWWAGNPVNMAKACFIATLSKQVAAGVSRTHIAMCDNFYTPKSRPEIDYQLSEMLRSITDLMVDLETPIISGKDSSSGTTKMTRKSDKHVEYFEIAPTLCMSAVGSGIDAMKIPPKALQKSGNYLHYLSAGLSNDASASVLLSDRIRGDQFNFDVNTQLYRKTIDHLSDLIDSGAIKSVSVVDDGGIIHRVFEMMLGSGLGVILETGDLEFLTKTVPGSFVLETESEDLLDGLDTVRLGRVHDKAEIVLGTMVLELDEMTQVWRKTWYNILQLPYDQKPVETPHTILPFSPVKITPKKVNIVYSPGINCHREMLRTWEKLACDTKIVSITDPSAKFADADIVVFPGGFADGDYLGAAKVWHRVMETRFRDQMDYLRSGKIPVIGICNGFQLMTLSGFFGHKISLTFNDSAVFEQRWVKLRFTPESVHSIWTKGLEYQEIIVPVAHGEGKFVIDEDSEPEKATIALQYDPDQYPNNPNGSTRSIAGIFAGDRGQFFGAMPHPERAIEDWHYTQHGMVFFENLLKNISS